jgi:hypothetical protein
MFFLFLQANRVIGLPRQCNTRDPEFPFVRKHYEKGATIPAAGTAHDAHGREHHRYFDQYSRHGGEPRAGFETKQADGGRNGKLEEIAGPVSADEPATQCSERTRRLCRWASLGLKNTESESVVHPRIRSSNIRYNPEPPAPC